MNQKNYAMISAAIESLIRHIDDLYRRIEALEKHNPSNPQRDTQDGTDPPGTAVVPDP